MIADATPVDWAQTGVIGGLVLLIIITGYRRFWLFFWVHRAIVDTLRDQLDVVTKEKDEWKAMALQQAGVIVHTVDRTAKIAYHAGDEQRKDRMDELIELLMTRIEDGDERRSDA